MSSSGSGQVGHFVRNSALVMLSTRILLILLVAVLLAVSIVTAQDKPPSTGPEVGTLAPDFKAPDQSGKLRTFRELTGENGLLLLFYRSADW